MDIQARIDELTQQQQAFQNHQQEDAINVQRLAGAIAILTELATDECLCECHDSEKEEEVKV
jgi:hypothetical protein